MRLRLVKSLAFGLLAIASAAGTRRCMSIIPPLFRSTDLRCPERPGFTSGVESSQKTCKIRVYAAARGHPSLQPGLECSFDVAAAAWPIETGLDARVRDHAERRVVADPEPLREIRPRVHVDPDHVKGLVVPASLQHLSEEAVDTPRGAVGLGVEEQQPRTGQFPHLGARHVGVRSSGTVYSPFIWYSRPSICTSAVAVGSPART